jgi:predicted DNA-binding transcriptional regulator AlpA
MSSKSLCTDKPLLTSKDLEAWFGVTDRTLRRWRRMDILPPPIRVGGVYRWKREDIEEFFAGLQLPPPGTCEISIEPV